MCICICLCIYVHRHCDSPHEDEGRERGLPGYDYAGPRKQIPAHVVRRNGQVMATCMFIDTGCTLIYTLTQSFAFQHLVLDKGALSTPLLAKFMSSQSYSLARWYSGNALLAKFNMSQFQSNTS